MKTHSILWWNLENLFETEDYTNRPDWLQKELKEELKGWDETVLEKKLSNLSAIISKVNNGLGPDIIGCCEIENESVLKKLINSLSLPDRDYEVQHKDTKDQRGIDVAFIYDKKKYNWDGYINSLEIMKRTATRDLVQVNLKTKGSNNDLILIGAHFPSRTSGQYETEPFRIMVGETLSYWIKRTIQKKKESNGVSDVAIVVMGDFNDEPFNRSLTEYAQATPDKKVIENAKTIDYLFNPMCELKGRGLNTYTFGNDRLIFDQILLSEGISKNEKPFKVQAIEIIAYEGMTKGDYNTPVRFSRPSKSDFNTKGFSDHLPVHLILEEI